MYRALHHAATGICPVTNILSLQSTPNFFTHACMPWASLYLTLLPCTMPRASLYLTLVGILAGFLSTFWCVRLCMHGLRQPCSFPRR